jgi:hypothetical protein
MTSKEPIRLDQDDLYTPAVESYLELQTALRRGTGELQPQSWFVRVVYSSWFYLAIASGAGGFIAWSILEPFIDDSQMAADEGSWGLVFIFPAVAAGIGLFLGAGEGIMCRNPLRALTCGTVGLGIGFAGGLIAICPTGLLFGVTRLLALSLMDEMPGPDELVMPTGFAFLVLMMGRAAAWAVAGIPAGLGQGIALREKKVILNGLVGGVLGGTLGGLLFDPISLLFTTADGQAAVSRAIGFTSIGLLVGLFVGLVEGWTKTAWLLMRAGPLAGKQFILFRDVTVLGSSPKADIYLFKDETIEPRHAMIYNRGGRFEIEDLSTPDGTYVNGIPIKRRLLESGDQIAMGKTVLEFSLQAAR